MGDDKLWTWAIFGRLAGFGLIIVQATLLLTKVFSMLTIGWFWVFTPIWAVIGVWLVAVLIILIGPAVAYIFRRKE
jgi:hypothetical protein